MARTINTPKAAPLPKFANVNIDTTENGFMVTGHRLLPTVSAPGAALPMPVSNSFHQNGYARAPERYTFETFASMSKWLSKNVVNGGA